MTKGSTAEGGTEQGTVRIGYSGTIGLPGYSSAKLEVSVDLPVAPKETVEKAIDRAWNIAKKAWERKIEEAIDTVEENTRKGR